MPPRSRYGADFRIEVDPNLFSGVTGDPFNSAVPPSLPTDSLSGTYLSSRIQNPQETAGILLSGELPVSWTRYMDLTDQSPNTYFLKHEKFGLKHDGTALFVPVVGLPGSPVEGTFLYTGDTHQFQFWNGTNWVGLSAGSVGVSQVQGTANQVSASPITGNVVVSLVNSGTLPGSWTAQTNFTVGGLATVGGEKNAQVKWSTLAPSGVAPDGTLWIQY